LAIKIIEQSWRQQCPINSGINFSLIVLRNCCNIKSWQFLFPNFKRFCFYFIKTSVFDFFFKILLCIFNTYIWNSNIYLDFFWWSLNYCTWIIPTYFLSCLINFSVIEHVNFLLIIFTYPLKIIKNVITSKSTTKSAINKDITFKTILPTLFCHWLSWGFFLDQMWRHNINLMFLILRKFISVNPASLCWCQLDINVVL